MITKHISLAVDVLNDGGLIAMPTETVYGLAGNALNEQAVRKIFELKKRPTCNPLILHTHSLSEVTKYVQKLPSNALKLAEAFWPGPLTLLLPKKSNIPHDVTSGSHLVAVRIPDHTVALSLLKRLDFPLVAPSANPYTRISPTNAAMVYDYFGEEVPVILDGGCSVKGIESTIVGFDGDTPIIYRQGAVSIDAIEFIVGKSKVQATIKDRVTTPGMAASHYAPKTKFIVVNDIMDFITKNPQSKIGVIVMGKPVISLPKIKCKLLSSANDLEEASANLYNAMYALDLMDLDYIIIESFPEIGIGRSLNDRITRAAY